MSTSPIDQVRQAELAANETVNQAKQKAAETIAAAEKKAEQLRVDIINGVQAQAKKCIEDARSSGKAELEQALFGIEDEIGALVSTAVENQPKAIDEILKCFGI